MNIDDTESCFRAVKSRDRRFDGVFYIGVITTGIYCRPSCPAPTPHKKNVRFFRTTAAAQAAGLRACKRCLPDATPGSPDWDIAADVAGRAMRLIADGVVERDGVEGLAGHVGYSSRHLHRLLDAEVGAGPLALARAGRAQTARILIETTRLPFAEVAFASGFASIRQFNDTVRTVYAATPSQLRAQRKARGWVPPSTPGRIKIRLAARKPFAGRELLGFLALRAVPGVEHVEGDTYHRTVRLPHGHAVVALTASESRRDDEAAFVECALRVSDLRDLAAAVERCRRLLDLDADPVAIDDQLAADGALAPLVSARPGLRVPGHVDGHELAVRAVLGQQVSVAGARTLAARLTEAYGEVVGDDEHVHRLFPSAEVLAEVDPTEIAMPRARGRALSALCTALASGELRLDRSADRADVRNTLLALPGIGPWTADYVAMRALGDPDVFLAGDVGVRRGLTGLGFDVRRAEDVSRAWRPWRSYAVMHLWSSLGHKTKEK